MIKKFLSYLLLLLCVNTLAQHNPGGVRSVSLWHNENTAIVGSTHKDVIGITAFQVIIPTAETENATLTSGRIVTTSRRVAEPCNGQYINFATDVNIGVPQLVSVRRRISEADTAIVNLKELPLVENSDSICESIVYKRMLNNAERQKVDTYLALKYGVTLNQTVPTSYVAPSGRIVWDATNNVQHSHHIAGLCNDTISRLYNATASNVETTEILRLSTDTITPTSYVICGDDNGSLKYIREENQPKRLGRSWQIATSGDSPERISLSFNAEQIQEAFPLQADEHYWLAIDDTSYVKSVELGNLEARFDSVPLSNGMTFTIVAAKGDEEPELEDNQTAEDNIYAAYVAPNPTTDGHVALRIRLRETAHITVSLYALDGHLYAKQSQSGEDFYNVRLTLPSQGVWIATIDSGKSRRSYKLISK